MFLIMSNKASSNRPSHSVATRALALVLAVLVTGGALTFIISLIMSLFGA